ncbi:N-acetylneuraminate synthase family protein [Roseivirga thermotolerans]|uniref:Polyhydroxyalkanoate synthesis repressor PhaR n=1 Tax=Roseivirga thermotolerans TaxID=1758176 RepID=A0ABQ3I4I5_9BACT|nr:N-acetylneuraminate synthase family protein [Roseivirga thermotolerans]GHE53521.1 polyhydroxyalkanoate synthesis repressor PhaR [Roseivirga thermotolerans]
MSSPYIEIAGRKIGYDYDPLVIAEIGINHGGSLSVAKEMVDAAASAGVEMVKHQTHIVADEMSSIAKNVIPGHTKESIYEIMDSCSLNEEEERELQRYTIEKGMIFISTPFSRAAADRLNSMNVPAYKIGSGECNNYPLLKHIASFGKPMILSTGMNTIESVAKALNVISEAGVQFAVLHTTNVYPTPPEIVRLGALQELAESFPGIVYGLSDHTTSNLACLGAVALGASILERHFTDSMDRIGPDIVCSMDPEACNELIEQSRIMKSMRGGKKGPVDEEKATIDFAYASVVTIKDVRKGEKFTKDNLWVKRPGTGEILAEDYEDILGKEATEDIPNDTLLKKSQIK